MQVSLQRHLLQENNKNNVAYEQSQKEIIECAAMFHDKNAGNPTSYMYRLGTAMSVKQCTQLYSSS